MAGNKQCKSTFLFLGLVSKEWEVSLKIFRVGHELQDLLMKDLRVTKCIVVQMEANH